MPNLNRVSLMGNLTRSPELKYTPKGTAVAEFGLAINRVYSTESGEKREETTFVDVTFFGKPAETIGKHVSKGAPLYVDGRLSLDQWEDKTSGQKRSKLKVIGETFQFLGGKREDDQERPAARPESQPPARKQPPKPPADPDLDADSDEDLPF